MLAADGECSGDVRIAGDDEPDGVVVVLYRRVEPCHVGAEGAVAHGERRAALDHKRAEGHQVGIADGRRGAGGEERRRCATGDVSAVPVGGIQPLVVAGCSSPGQGFGTLLREVGGEVVAAGHAGGECG